MISAGDMSQALPEPAQLPSELARLVAESIAEKQRGKRGSTPPLVGRLPAMHAKQAPERIVQGKGDDCPLTESSAGNSRHAAASDSPIASSVHE